MKFLVALFLGAILLLADFKSVHGLQCYNCKYMKRGNKVVGDSECKSGFGSLPLVECDENEYKASHPNQVNKFRQGCLRNEIEADAGGTRLTLITRECGFTLDQRPGCRSKAVQDLNNLPPDVHALFSGYDKLNICTCFKDGCNTNSEDNYKGGGGGGGAADDDEAKSRASNNDASSSPFKFLGFVWSFFLFAVFSMK